MGARRWPHLLEAGGVFALILAYIWVLRARWPWLWAPMLAGIAVSHWRRGEGPARLGLTWGACRLSFPVIFPWLLNLAMWLWGAGVVFGTLRDAPAAGVLRGFATYILWGTFQQYLLNGYLVNRLRGGLPERVVPAVAAALFAAVHAPNPFLMAVTLPAGYVCARLFLRYRSVLSLGVAHGILGFLLYLVVPDSISRGLRVG